MNKRHLKAILLGHDNSLDLNNHHEVKLALKKMRWRIAGWVLLYNVSVLLAWKIIGSFEPSLGHFLLLLPLLYLAFMYNAALVKLVRSNAMSCNNCGMSLVSLWQPSIAYYQCKKCGTKP